MSILRCAGHVMTEGNTLLKTHHLEKIIVLRMNRAFMKFMREHYANEIKEQFGQTVIDVEPKCAPRRR